MSNARKLADNLPSEGSLSGRNMLINGDMRIAQRSTAAHNEGTGYFALDRWRQEKANQDQFTYSVEQVSDGPSGFSKCLRVTTSTAETALASDEFGRIQQIIEGNNLERIGFGTADAKPFTLSFYVKSSVTGNYAVSFYVADANVIYNKAYTINTANTWEYKTLTFPAYTTAGPTIDNTAGLFLNFGLFAGSAKTTVTTNWTSYTQAYLFGGQTANLAATLNSSWRITGVQLEVGSQSTPFEHEPAGVTLSKCQRYYYAHLKTGTATKYIGMGDMYTTTQLDLQVNFPVPMRVSPTLIQTSGTTYWRGYGGNGSLTVSNNWTFWLSNTENTVGSHYVTADSSTTPGFAMRIINLSSSAALAYDAEL